MRKLIDLTGQIFGRLKVTSRAENRNARPTWHCDCECGNSCIARGGDLRSGRHRSCGCLQMDAATRHGHSSYTGPPSPTYKTWIGMIQRCTNQAAPHYDTYGGRGITVCEKWRNFIQFLKDMGERPEGLTLDRKNTNGNYEPDNCQWSTRKEQGRNRRSNRMIEYKGETHCISEWADILGISHELIRSRLKIGWSFEDAVETPVMKNRDSDSFTGQFKGR
jgi:hypothetical protein